MMSTSKKQSIQVHAYAIADTISLRDFQRKLGEDPKPLRVSKTHLFFAYDEERFLVVHDFGSIVFFNVDQAEQARVLEVLRSFAYDGSKEPFFEDFRIVLGEQEWPSAEFDQLTVREFTPAVAELVALSVGQSAAMEYYESDVDKLLAKIDSFSAEIAQKGNFGGRVRELTRFIGQGMQLRNRVILTLSLLDSPAIAWDDAALDRASRELRFAFAIEDRYRALDHKLSMIRDSLELILDLTQQKRSMLLEIGVVILIAAEIVLFLMK